MSNVDWAAIKQQTEQTKKSFYKSTWQKPELNQKSFFILRADIEPKPVYVSFEGGKYIEHEAPAKGISTKYELTIEVDGQEEKLRVSKGFFDKMVIDIAELQKTEQNLDRLKVKVRTVLTSKGDSSTLDFIDLEKV